MLETLKIKNLAIIDFAEVHFDQGLNILSGETGAGKSIIIEAISLILGGRSSSNLIRSNCNEATVEGLFNLTQTPWVKEKLLNHGFDDLDETLLIKRIVSRQNKQRIYINGELATVSLLKTIAEGLVDLCGQHEHQTLLKSQTQMSLLDQFGGLEVKAKEFTALLREFKKINEKYKSLFLDKEEKVKRLDYLKFQEKELTQANLNIDEDIRLREEKQLLQSFQQRVEKVGLVSQLLDSRDFEEKCVLDLLRLGQNHMSQLEELDPVLKKMSESWKSCLLDLEELSHELSSYLNSADMDPERLKQVQERLALIADLKRKYGETITEVIHTHKDIQSNIDEIENSDVHLGHLEEQLNKTKDDLVSNANKLSASRKKAADFLSCNVTTELKELKMENALFSVEVSEKKDLSAWSDYMGGNDISFLVNTNAGDVSKPLGKIASGGELSRLMLAIRTVISDQGGVGVYLFDEIDAGIGGQTAFQVGKKLKEVAKSHQVICITHLPQIACFSDHHWVVTKGIHSKRTVTKVIHLEKQENKKEEIARMLGGDKKTLASLKNADELLERACNLS